MKEYAQAQPSGRIQPDEGCPGGGVLNVVDPGHAEAVSFCLRVEERLVQPIGRRARQHPGHQLDGALEQQSRWLARGVPHDPPTRRIRCIPLDPRGPERRGVDPRRVHVDAVEVDRTRLHRIERRAVRGVVPAVGVPPLSQHPALLRRPPGDSAHRLRPGGRGGQLYSPTTERPKREVGVSINEPGSHQGVAELVAGETSGSLAQQTRVRTHGLHLAALPPDRVARGPWREGLYPPSPEDSAGGNHGRHRFPHVDNRRTCKSRVGDSSIKISVVAFIMYFIVCP